MVACQFPKSLTMKKYVLGGVDGYPEGGYTPLLAELRRIAAERGKTVPQVSINYVLSKGAIPIPGARNAEMAAANMGAMGWRLEAGEVAALEAALAEKDAALAALQDEVARQAGEIAALKAQLERGQLK